MKTPGIPINAVSNQKLDAPGIRPHTTVTPPDQTLNRQNIHAQQRLEDAQALGHIGSFETVAPYKEIICSDELYRIHGLKPQSEIITIEKVLSFIHPDDKEMFIEMVSSLNKGPKSFDLIYKVILKNKSTRTLQLRIRADLQVETDGCKVYGIVQDITELVKAQKKQQESEKLLRSAELAGGTGSYEGDIATFTFRFSPGLYTLLGIKPRDEVPTLAMIDAASHPDDVERVRKVLEHAIENKQAYEYYRRIFREDGQMRYMHSRGKVVCNRKGEPVKIIGTVHDITDQVHTEEKLCQSEQSFRTLVNNVPDIITRWDQDLNVTFTSRPAEITTNSLLSSLDKEDIKQGGTEGDLTWKEKLKQLFLTGEKQIHYSSWPLYDSMCYFHTQLVPELSDDNKVRSALAISHDITPLKKLEQENTEQRLLHQKKLILAVLDTLEAERKRISEGLHNGICQLLYAAKLYLDHIPPQNLKQDTQSVQDTLNKTGVILEQAIKETRRLSHELTPTVLEEIGLEKAVKEICNTFNTPDLRFQCWVFNLKHRLEKHMQLAVYRIAQELANNIVKHADASEASLVLREKKNCLLLLAEDNGKGFEQMGGASKGIGYKSMQDRVKLLNGTMSVDSAPGRGTLVQIYLPLT